VYSHHIDFKRVSPPCREGKLSCDFLLDICGIIERLFFRLRKRFLKGGPLVSFTDSHGAAS
jgi:hypothetical protein